MSRTVFVLNGPNLNLLGSREPAVYGTATLADVQALCARACERRGLTLEFRQSNHEGDLVDWVQEARAGAAGIVINPGGYSHTSIALMDALLAAERPVVEVHLSNVFRREDFRRHSFVSLAARGVICGLGPKGYELAIEAIADLVQA